MRDTNIGHTLLQALRAIVVSTLKIIAIIIGGICASIGFVLSKIGQFTLKLAKK